MHACEIRVCMGGVVTAKWLMSYFRYAQKLWTLEEYLFQSMHNYGVLVPLTLERQLSQK